MNKLMLASFTAILAGAMTMPAFADDNGRRAGGESSWQGRGGSKGPHRVERSSERADRDGDRDWSRDRDGRHDGDRNASRDRDWRGEWRNDRHDWRPDQRRDGRYYTRYRDSRWSGYNWLPQYRYRAPTRYLYPSGYRPYRWTIGYRMPYQYYSPRSYWIDYRVDYRMYRLPPPPYGYTWVRVDRDVVLVSLASGLIRDVLFGLFY